MKEENKPMADINSIMEWLNKKGMDGDTNIFSTRGIAGLIQEFIAQWVRPVPNEGITDDLKQYITNLLYAAYDKGKEPINPIVFDLDVEEWVNGIDEFFKSL